MICQFHGGIGERIILQDVLKQSVLRLVADKELAMRVRRSVFVSSNNGRNRWILKQPKEHSMRQDLLCFQVIPRTRQEFAIHE